MVSYGNIEMTENNRPNEQNKLPFKESHAFIIGIDAYKKFSKLRTAINDAKKLAEILAGQHGFNVHPPLLDASSSDIKLLLKKIIIEKVKKEDRCLFYFAGHGIAMNSEDKPGGYIIPVDAVQNNTGSFIAMNELYDDINKLPCKHLLLILDCCFSGSFKWSTRFRHIGFLPNRIFKERFDRFVRDQAWQVITSAGSDQKAQDYDLGNPDIFEEIVLGKRDNKRMLHSPFAAALFKGLAGAADLIPEGEGDGVITASELYLYLREQVEPSTIKISEKIRQTPGIFPLEKHDKGEYVFLCPNHRLNLQPIPKRNPYKGLQSFEEGDKELFFGRERVVKDLLEKIYESNLVVVTGASGTGKSSVVKAGLIPGLRQQGYHILPVIRPGIKPVDVLEKALNESKLFAAEVFLTKDMNAILDKLIQDKTVLVIDQYEELITQCKEGKERDFFVGVLKHFLDHNHTNNFKIIFTVRADFEPQFDGSGLKKYWKNSRYPVPPFTTEELREVIVKPVVQEVLSIEPPGLVGRMIDEVIQAPGALPLLSFTLAELYQLYIKNGRTDRVLREEDYKELGGVVGALRTCADNLYNNYNLQPENQVTIRKIMLRLVSFEGGEPAGKKVLMEDLVFSDEENSRVKTIIDGFLEARLLRKDKDAANHVYIEPAHDALIKAWAALWEWIKAYGEDKILSQNRLSEAVKEYAARKDNRMLWHDNPRLEFFIKEQESPDSLLNNNEVIFVKESIKVKGQKRRRFITSLVSIIIILTVLSAFAIYKANEAATKAKIAQSNYLASQAQLKLKNDPMTAIRLAEEACRLYKKNNVAKRVLADSAASTLERPFYNADMTHNGHVNDVVFSLTGDRILTSSSDKTAKLWDLQGNCLAAFSHKDVVYTACFSPDGTKILTVSRENHAQMWDTQGTLLKKFTHHRMVTSAVFSPHDRFILTASMDNTAKLWNYQGHALKEYIHPEAVKKAVFSPDGTRILTAADDKIARLWDKQGNLSCQFPGVLYAEFSHKGNYIITISVGNTVKLYSQEGSILKTFNGHNRVVKYVTCSPCEQGMLIVYMDSMIKFWDWQGRISNEFSTHEDSILSAVFSPDGNKILTASRDNTAKLWDTNGNLKAEFDAHKDTIISAVFSPNGSKILTASQDKTAKLWDLKNQLVTNIHGHARAVTFSAFSPDGTRLLSLSDDKTVKVWDLHGCVTANIEGHSNIINTAVFSPDGTKILTASADKTAKLWNLHGNLLTNFDKHTANVNSAVFSPDGRSILTASYDHTAKLWNLQGKVLTDYRLHRNYVNRAIFSPDGKKVLTASYDETVKLWDLQGNLLKDFNLHNMQVEFALFSPGGTRILTVYTSPSVATLWDLNGELLANFQEHTDSIIYAAFSPDGSRIITASNDGTAKLWDLQGNLLTDFKGHNSIVYSVVFSPDGTRVLTASADNTVKFWDLQGNILVDFKKHKGVVYSAVFSPDGTKILSASADKTIKLWYTPGTIIQWLKTAAIPLLPLKETNW